MLVTLIVFILILGLLIFVHELGHFIMAKRAGIKVEEFAFGFPPRLFAVKKGETEYALNLFPIGGYVKMLGEEEDASKSEKANPRSFAHQSVWTRSKVVVAGVIMNFILAWVLISLGYMVGMTPLASDAAKIPYAQTNHGIVVSAVGKDSAADLMGIKPGDYVSKFNGMPITTAKQLPEITKQHKGEEATIEIMRKGVTQTVSGKLGTGEGPLGVRIDEDTKVKLPIWWAPFYGLWETLKAIGLVFTGIVDFFRQLVVRHHIPAEAAGPVGIFYYTRSVLELGLGATLSFIAILSVNLGVINIMPIPALDGGRFLFILLEKFNKGKKLVNQEIENIAHLIGFILLMALIVTITYHDILKIGH